MICRFCQQELKTTLHRFGGFEREITHCDNHQPLSVTFKVIRNAVEIFTISTKIYNIRFYNNMVHVQKVNRNPVSVKDAFTFITQFYDDKSITPENCQEKLKMILAFV